jgi:O-antigen ligase
LHITSVRTGFELLILSALVPVFWFPFRWPILTLLALPVIPILWMLRLRRRDPLVALPSVEWPLLGVLAATCLASTPDFDAALAAPKVLGMAIGAGFLVCIANAIRLPGDLDRCLTMMAIALLVLCAAGVVSSEWTLGKSSALDAVLGRLPVIVRGIVPNTSQGGVNPNELAGVLTLWLPLMLTRLLALWSKPQRAKVRRLTAVAAAAGVMLLVATQSRGAIVGLGVVLAVLAAWLILPPRRTDGPGSRWRWPLRLAYGVGLVALAATGWVVVSRWLAASTENQGPDSFAGRSLLWSQALAMVRDFPVTGVGLGQFDPVLHLLYLPAFGTPGLYVPHAHNLVLAYAVELGVPGAIAFGLLVAAALRGCLGALQAADGEVRWSALGLALGLLGFMIFGLTDAIAPGARGGLLLWVSLGMAVALKRTAAQSDASCREPQQVVGKRRADTA